MAVVVIEGCIKCKYTDCAEVCPVDCFYEGENMLVINPQECIDCGLCEPVCPIEAIVPDSYPEAAEWVKINVEYSKLWPQISYKKKAPHPQADAFKAVKGKYPEHFDPRPAVQQPGDAEGSTKAKKAWGLGKA
jgi:ferredoxin